MSDEAKLILTSSFTLSDPGKILSLLSVFSNNKSPVNGYTPHNFLRINIHFICTMFPNFGNLIQKQSYLNFLQTHQVKLYEI